MSIESDLKKDGIEVISQLDTLRVNSIARAVSIGLCETFPSLKFNQNELFIKLSRLNMYVATMPDGMAEANYFYKNSSIYFNSKLDDDDLEEFAIHECIHYLQEVKDKRNYLLRMGLCDYTEFKIYGLGLNEAAVQLMASKVLAIPKEYVKYYNLSFETTSPSYYPLECCLANQLAYIVGEDVLFESTFNSNDNFKKKLVEAIGYKNFMTVQENFDKILMAEEDIIKINNKILQIDDRNKKVDNMINKIGSLKNSITTNFIKTQNLIISSYFDKAFLEINDLEGVENYRRRLYNFKDYLASTDNYTFFNNYYVDKMVDLEDKYNLLENSPVDSSMYLVKRKNSKILLFFRFIRSLFISKNFENSKNQSNN